MISTGYFRKVDDLGRIVLPKEVRHKLSIHEKDTLEIFIKGNFILMQKSEPSCIFCGNATEIQQFMGRNLCSSCVAQISESRGKTNL